MDFFSEKEKVEYVKYKGQMPGKILQSTKTCLLAGPIINLIRHYQPENEDFSDLMKIDVRAKQKSKTFAFFYKDKALRENDIISKTFSKEQLSYEDLFQKYQIQLNEKSIFLQNKVKARFDFSGFTKAHIDVCQSFGCVGLDMEKAMYQEKKNIQVNFFVNAYDLKHSIINLFRLINTSAKDLTIGNSEKIIYHKQISYENELLSLSQYYNIIHIQTSIKPVT